MIVNGHFRDKFYGLTKMTKPNCLAGSTNVSYQCILLCCMAQAHANSWRIEQEWFQWVWVGSNWTFYIGSVHMCHEEGQGRQVHLGPMKEVQCQKFLPQIWLHDLGDCTPNFQLNSIFPHQGTADSKKKAKQPSPLSHPNVVF